MAPVSIMAFYGTWLEGEERAKKKNSSRNKALHKINHIVSDMSPPLRLIFYSKEVLKAQCTTSYAAG